ncbi:MAG: RNA 2',3'-cyclic phosphodiesterase [Chloroflexi bacterium]|nr:RNA 2',3'-cyclic phosphodiesterase [Chloroflexota bacterium]
MKGRHMDTEATKECGADAEQDDGGVTLHTGSEHSIRAFIGIRVSHAGHLVEALLDDRELQQTPVRWSMTENLHVTLAFLGEVEGEALRRLWPEVCAAVKRLRSFPVGFTTPKLFPSPENPRIVALEVDDQRGQLMGLRRALMQACQQAGMPVDERSFRPHMSLGRIRPPLLRGQVATLALALQERGWPVVEPFLAQHVSLFRSDLFPDGARYVELGRAALAGRAGRA